jgi:hypothetical protein
MAAAAGMPDSAGVGLDRARGGAEVVWGEVERLRVRRFGGVQLELCATRTRGRRGDGRKEMLPGLREDKGDARRMRIARMNDAWRARRRPQRRRHSTEQGKNSNTFE